MPLSTTRRAALKSSGNRESKLNPGDIHVLMCYLELIQSNLITPKKELTFRVGERLRISNLFFEAQKAASPSTLGKMAVAR